MIFNCLVESKKMRDNFDDLIKSLPDNNREFQIITSDEEKNTCSNARRYCSMW